VEPVVELLQHIVDVPDWPQPGVVFKDIAPLLRDHDVFAATIDLLAAPGREANGLAAIDKVVGIEARGFILAAPVALALGVGFVPVRKEGKLPRDTYGERYALEYGEAVLEVQQDAFVPQERVLVVDDVLATGGTVAATSRLISRAGATVAAVSVLLELGFLAGREQLADLPLHAVLTV
jgi:adenine phosphoribosyltransferase